MLLIVEMFILLICIQRALLFGEGLLKNLDEEIMLVKCGVKKVYSLNHGQEFRDHGCSKYFNKIKIHTRSYKVGDSPRYFFRIDYHD